MSRHAENLHMGASVIGAGLISAIMANDQARKAARQEAEAEASSVAAVRALRMEMAASLRREAALREEVNRFRFDLLRTQSALRRALAQGR